MKKRWRWVLLVVLLMAIIGAWCADRSLKRHEHPGLVTFMKQWWRNYPKSFKVEPAVISITVDEEGMNELEGVVDRAREKGVIEQEGNDFVKAMFSVQMPGDAAGSGAFKGKLRIKGKMTDHVQGKKWSFRVIAKKDGGFLGMKRFSLQHPGTRNYLCDWFYHELMKGEGLIALRYGFCKVKLNDDDLGVYAYEEHFGPELLENNGRVPGPIVRFDPSLFWQHRLNGLDGIHVDDAFGAYQAANLDAFGSDEIAQDPQQKKYFEQAITLMARFRSGELAASQVFDVDRTARRLAMLDLVGGHHSMDWSDVKFYFDPVAQRFEPISYESFSANPTKELAGAYKFTGPFQQSDELHEAFFKDPAIFSAYVHHLERFSQKHYLDSAFTALKGALDTASATMYAEFPYKELDRSIYYANQKAILTMLNVPKGFHAYSNGVKGDTLTMGIVPLENLPMHVEELVLNNGEKVTPLQQVIVPCRERGKLGVPMEIKFVLPHATDSVLLSGLKVNYRVLGASKARHLDMFPFTLSVSSAQDELLVGMKPNVQDFQFLILDEAAKTIGIKPGSWTIDHTLVVPSGYRCTAAYPLQLNLTSGAEIISYSPLEWKGDEESPIRVFSADSSSHGVHVIEARGISHLADVEFTGLTRYKYDQERSGDVSFHKSDVEIADCRFIGTGATLLDASVGHVSMDGCSFIGGSDQLEVHFTDLLLNACTFQGAHDDAVSCEGGSARMKDLKVLNAAGIAVKGTKAARIDVVHVGMSRVDTGVEGREGARIMITGGTMDGVGCAVEAKKLEMRYGPVKVELKQVEIKGAKAEPKCGAGSRIIINGKKVGGTNMEQGT